MTPLDLGLQPVLLMESAVTPGVRPFWRSPGIMVWIVSVWAVRAGLLRW
ncbi:hypothetical protein [Synechococcus sp. SYN20]|nr:hypothetical protein [Synechococcus sp. SYN20]